MGYQTWAQCFSSESYFGARAIKVKSQWAISKGFLSLGNGIKNVGDQKAVFPDRLLSTRWTIPFYEPNNIFLRQAA
jgi:hypothetical protein